MAKRKWDELEKEEIKLLVKDIVIGGAIGGIIGYVIYSWVAYFYLLAYLVANSQELSSMWLYNPGRLADYDTFPHVIYIFIPVILLGVYHTKMAIKKEYINRAKYFIVLAYYAFPIIKLMGAFIQLF